MNRCNICPRECNADRSAGETGFCGMADEIVISRAALHFWEEPCISGYSDYENGSEASGRGSGAVFFTGCNLGCIYCQNAAISGVGLKSRHNADERQIVGRTVSIEELADIFLRLQDEDGAHNINLVTAVHFVPKVAKALERAKDKGLIIPIIYNSGGYEKAETLKTLDGLVDVYLPDFKYFTPELAREYSNAYDYPEIVKLALAEMYRQVGRVAFKERSAGQLICRGMIVRNLLLPGHVRESEQVIKYLYETYGDNIYISLMSQYTPMPCVSEHPLLARRVTKREYDRLLDYAINLGIKNAFLQDRKVAEKSFIPDWNSAETEPGKE